MLINHSHLITEVVWYLEVSKNTAEDLK